MKNERVLLTNIALWAAYDGLTTVYLVAFALALGASNVIVGLLGALPFLASILTQIPGAELVQHVSRRRVFLMFAGVAKIFWLPLMLAPFFLAQPLPAVIVFYLIIKLCESITDPSSTSLIADDVPVKARGEFTSKRIRLIGSFGMVAMILGGLWLKHFPKESPLGFALMFAAGALIGIFSVIIFCKIDEPMYADHVHHPIKDFLTFENGHLRRFVLFSIAFNFAFMLASPFFAVYMLKNLGVGYEYYGIVSSVTTFAQIISSRYIGRLADKYGDKPLAIIGHLGTAFVPLLFLLITKQTLWLLIPVQLFSGIVWAAADLSRFNLLLDLSDGSKRAMQIAEYNLYANIPLVISPILGGWMTEHVAFFIAGIPLIFMVSSALRAGSVLLLIGIKEPRSKIEYNAAFVFREAMHFHPGRGIVHGVHVLKRTITGLVR